MTRLTVVRSGMPAPDPAPGETVLTYDQFRAELRTGGLMKRLFRAGESRLLVHRVSSAGRPVSKRPVRQEEQSRALFSARRSGCEFPRRATALSQMQLSSSLRSSHGEKKVFP